MNRGAERQRHQDNQQKRSGEYPPVDQHRERSAADLWRITIHRQDTNRASRIPSTTRRRILGLGLTSNSAELPPELGRVDPMLEYLHAVYEYNRNIVPEFCDQIGIRVYIDFLEREVRACARFEP